MNHKLESKSPGEINNLRYADDITVTAESGEELKMRVKEKNEKARFSFLHCAKAFMFNLVPFVYFCFYLHFSRRWVIEDLAVIYVRPETMKLLEENIGKTLQHKSQQDPL